MGRIVALGSVCAVAGATVAAFLAFAPNAEATSGSVSINSGGLASGSFDTNGSTVVVQPGDSVTFSFGSFPASPGHLSDVTSLVVSGLPGGSATISKSASKHVTFSSSGSVNFSWAGHTTLLNAAVPNSVVAGSNGGGSVDIVAPGTPTPTDPGSSTSSGGTGGGGGGSTATNTPTGGTLPSSSRTPGNPNVHISGPSDHGLASSSNRPGSTTPGGSITFPTESPGPDTPTTSISTQVIVQADATRGSHHGRPTGLAIISILALAAVTGAYIYQYVGGFGALRGATAGGRASRGDEQSGRRGPKPGPRANHFD